MEFRSGRLACVAFSLRPPHSHLDESPASGLQHRDYLIPSLAQPRSIGAKHTKKELFCVRLRRRYTDLPPVCHQARLSLSGS